MIFSEKTLYHGTVIDNEPTIRQFGLVGGWHGSLGDFVQSAYGDEYNQPTEDDEVIYATDKNNLNKAINAMVYHISKKLNKDFHDVSDNDIRNHGLLIIIKDSELKPHDPNNIYDRTPIGLEPGDYHDSSMNADILLKGSSLIRFLKKQGQWPRNWGVDSGQRKNLLLAKNKQKTFKFKEWIGQSTVGTEFVDEKQIDTVYDKAKLSVALVQLYDKMTNQKLLTNISTIVPLTTGVYGLYSSAENKKVIGNDILNKVRMKFGNDVMSMQNIQKIPNVVLKKYIPDVDLNKVQPSDIIRVNIQKILRELGDTKQAILEIASTIVHEATHELEFQTLGKTSEIGPKAAEKKFIDWVNKNWKNIISRIPKLSNL